MQAGLLWWYRMGSLLVRHTRLQEIYCCRRILRFYPETYPVTQLIHNDMVVTERILEVARSYRGPESDFTNETWSDQRDALLAPPLFPGLSGVFPCTGIHPAPPAAGCPDASGSRMGVLYGQEMRQQDRTVQFMDDDAGSDSGSGCVPVGFDLDDSGGLYRHTPCTSRRRLS